MKRMENFLNLYNELARLERSGKVSKQVHRLRKAVIWKRIAQIAVNQSKDFLEGVEAKKVIDYGAYQLEFLLNELGNEIQNFKEEQKKIKERTKQILLAISEIVKSCK